VSSRCALVALPPHPCALADAVASRSQPLARSPSASEQPNTTSALRAWAQADGGSIARTTAYHAAQLLALCRPASATPAPLQQPQRASSASRAGTPAPGSSGGTSDGPLEPFALFYAALALVAFVREGGASASAGEPAGAELALDVVRARSDSTLGGWLQHSSSSSAKAVVALRALGDTASQRRLDGPWAAARVLGVCARRLRELKVWKVGDLLAGVLEQLAAVERAKSGGGGEGMARTGSAGSAASGVRGRGRERGLGRAAAIALALGMRVDGDEDDDDDFQGDDDDDGDDD